MTSMMSLLSEKMNDVCKTDDGGFKYYLNNDETLKKLKKNAKNTEDLEELPLKKDNTIRIQFSTGAYMLAVAPLISFWKKNIGKQINSANTGGLDVTINDVVRDHDANGTTTQWIVHLMVEGEQVTITCYDTQVKMMIQGARMKEEYSKKALIPYLKDEINDRSKAIAQLNNDISQYDPSPKTGAVENSHDNSAASKAKSKPNVQKLTRASKKMLVEHSPPPLTMQSPPSSPPAPTSPTNLAARTPLPPSPITMAETHPSTPPPRLDLTKSQILPDIPFLTSLEENPTDDEDDEDDLEDASFVQAVEKQQPPNPPRKSVIVLGKKSDASPTNSPPPQHLYPNVVIRETIEEDVVVRAEDENPYQCGTCGKTFRDELSTNNHLETHTEIGIEKRMEKLEKLMESERKASNYRIELLEHKVAALKAELNKARQVAPRPLSEPNATAPRNNIFSCSTCGHQAPTIHVLKAHISNSHPYPTIAKAPQVPETVPLLACDKCSFTATSAHILKSHMSTAHNFKSRHCETKAATRSELDKHVETNHRNLTPKLHAETSIMIGDSNMKTVNCRIVETALGGGKLFCGNHIASACKEKRNEHTGRPGSAYNSDPDYPGSRYRNSSFKEVVPRMIAQQPCHNLILQSPASDLTNLSQVPEHQHQGWAEQSSRNMVLIAEQAILQKPEMKKVILLEHLPRVDSDHLTALASHANSALRHFASTSIFSNQIFVASHSSLNPTTDEKKVAIFGPRGDGIHLRGREGPMRHTSSVISALQSVGIAGWTTQSSGGSAKPQKTTYSQALRTSNRFQPLNC